MNLNHSQLIAAITPGYQQAHTDYSAADVQRTLESYDIATLRRMYDRQVAAGIIQQPEEPPRVPEGITQVVRQQVANTPEALENPRLKNEMVRNQGFAIIFTTPVPEAGGRTATDNQANRETIQAWAEAETTPINNVKTWWLGIFKQNPGLAVLEYGPLLWDKLPIPKTKLKADQQVEHQKNWQTFIDYCRTSGKISASHANFNAVIQTLGSPLRYEELNTLVIDLPSGPALLTANGDTVELAAQTRAEQEQFRQERVVLDQAHLRDLRATNSITALKARAHRDHDSGQPSFYQPNIQNDPSLQQEYQLSRAYEQEVIGGRQTDPLPSHFRGKPLDAPAIRALFFDRPAIRLLIEKYGNARITARLYGIKKVRRFDSVGNVIEGVPGYTFEGE